MIFQGKKQSCILESSLFGWELHIKTNRYPAEFTEEHFIRFFNSKLSWTFTLEKIWKFHRNRYYSGINQKKNLHNQKSLFLRYSKNFKILFRNQFMYTVYYCVNEWKGIILASVLDQITPQAPAHRVSGAFGQSMLLLHGIYWKLCE